MRQAYLGNELRQAKKHPCDTNIQDSIIGN